MKILGLILLILIIAGVAHVYKLAKLQRKRDQRFLGQLRANVGTLALRTTILEEGISLADQSTVLRERTIEGGELLLGKGFLLPVYLMAAIHNPAALPVGAEGITWSIPLENWEMRGDSLTVLCTLPDEEDSFTRLTFEGLLADGRREAVLDALGLSH